MACSPSSRKSAKAPSRRAPAPGPCGWSPPGRFTGTLTDATGPVAVTVSGARATIRYRTPDGITIRQQLALQADGRTLLNRLDAYKFGLRVATVDETISRPLAK